jgi:hypothetical protein
MKTLQDGQLSESDGPPLDHDEWVAATKKAHADADADRAKKTAALRAATSKSGAATTDAKK